MSNLQNFISELRGLVNLGGGRQVSELDGGSGDKTPTLRTTKMGWAGISEAIGKFAGSDTKILSLDSHYWVPEERSFNQLVSYWKNTDGSNIYQGDSYDCEDFAIGFMNLARNRTGANSVGLVYDGDSSHAYNIIVFNSTDALNAMLFEPNFFSPNMSGGFVEPDDDIYTPETATILI